MLLALRSLWEVAAAALSGTPVKRPRARKQFQLPPFAEPGIFVSDDFEELGKEELIVEEQALVLAALELD